MIFAIQSVVVAVCLCAVRWACGVERLELLLDERDRRREPDVLETAVDQTTDVQMKIEADRQLSFAVIVARGKIDADLESPMQSLSKVETFAVRIVDILVHIFC